MINTATPPTETPFGPATIIATAASEDATLSLAGGVSVAAGSYNVRVQCWGNVNNTMGFMRGSLTVTVAPT